MKLLHKGSAKDVYIYNDNQLSLKFTDRVSVFDYGSLPDEIPNRGECLKNIALEFEKIFVKHDILSSTDLNLSLKENSFIQQRAEHPSFPEYKSKFKFVPLEVIFRLGVPEGSSLLKRRPDLKPNTFLDECLVEFSTKLESKDRMIDDLEAAEIAGSAKLIEQLRNTTLKCAKALQSEFKKIGLVLWDGKLEFGYDSEKDQVLLVDAITPDELRITLPGLNKVPLSKQLIRLWLGQTGWSYQLKLAQKEHKDSWKEKVSLPPRLGKWRVNKFTDLYDCLLESIKSQDSSAIFKWIKEDKLVPKVFVMGEGGRESAQKWRLKQENVQIVADPKSADVVWVSKDGDLAEGAADIFREQGMWVFGPNKNASKIEWDKKFGREIAQSANIPGPKVAYKIEDARKFSHPPVIKKIGLAAGKGVFVSETWDDFDDYISNLPEEVLFEEMLTGFEASAFFLVNMGSQKQQLSYLGCAQDFKRRYLGDDGPNTGGMGAYSPHPKIVEKDISIFKNMAEKTLSELKKKNIIYNGILYLGLIKTTDTGWNLLEYNSRFGDPEAQAILSSWDSQYSLRSCLGLSVFNSPKDISFDKQSICVAMVHKDYPSKSEPLDLPPWNEMNSSKVFLSGSTTGRVAFVVGSGESFTAAGDNAFELLVNSPWKDQLDWRKDILP